MGVHIALHCSVNLAVFFNVNLKMDTACSTKCENWRKNSLNSVSCRIFSNICVLWTFPKGCARPCNYKHATCMLQFHSQTPCMRQFWSLGNAHSPCHPPCKLPLLQTLQTHSMQFPSRVYVQYNGFLQYRVLNKTNNIILPCIHSQCLFISSTSYLTFFC